MDNTQDFKSAVSSELDLTSFDKKIGALLIHGLTGTPTEMCIVERHLKKKGVQVSVPLLAGHGVTNAELLESTWTDWLESARKELRRLCDECDSVFIAGMCMGATLAMVLAIEEPKVSGIILISPDGGIPAKGASKLAALLPIGFLLPKFLQKKFYWVEKPPYGLRDPVLQEEITYTIKKSKDRESKEFGNFRTYVASFYEQTLLRKQAFRIAKDIRCAAFIMQSTEDTLMDPSNALVIYNKLGCKDKEISYISGCDHVMTVDLLKREVAARIEGFMVRVMEQDTSTPIALTQNG